MEKTLVLIKPDAVEQNIIGNIISLYEEAKEPELPTQY